MVSLFWGVWYLEDGPRTTKQVVLFTGVSKNSTQPKVHEKKQLSPTKNGTTRISMYGCILKWWYPHFTPPK